MLHAQEHWLNTTQFPMRGMRRKSCGPGDQPPTTGGKHHLRGEEQFLGEGEDKTNMYYYVQTNEA